MKLSEENALNTFFMHIVHNYIDTFPVRNVFPLDLEFLCALFANDSLPDIKKKQNPFTNKFHTSFKNVVSYQEGI